MLFASCGMERVFTLIWWVGLAHTGRFFAARPAVSNLLQVGFCGWVTIVNRRTCV